MLLYKCVLICVLAFANNINKIIEKKFRCHKRKLQFVTLIVWQIKKTII